MAKIPLFKQDGSKTGDVELSNSVFGIKVNKDVVTDAVLMQQASKRQGTHSVKNRSAVSGGGKKPWRQKGTGNARQGSIRAPQWRGGGVATGPSPRSYKYKINRKAYRLALKSVLSDKLANDALILVDKLYLASPSTKNFLNNILKKLKPKKNILLVLDGTNKNIELSAHNLANIKLNSIEGINVYDILRAQTLIFEKSAALKVQEALN